jgi:hypothetical protein
MSPRGIKGSGSGANKKPKTNTKRDIGDPTFDLIKVFAYKDIGTMDDIELEQRITDLQRMRLMRFTTAKRTTALDSILSQIDIDKARMYLEGAERVEQEKQEKQEKI